MITRSNDQINRLGQAAHSNNELSSNRHNRENERLKREYHKVIEEEKELSPILQLDDLVKSQKLARRRYLATQTKWHHHMDSKERVLRRNELMFLMRNPN